MRRCFRPKVETTDLVPTGHGICLPPAPTSLPARTMFAEGPDGDAQFETHLNSIGDRIRALERNQRSRLRSQGQGTKKLYYIYFRGRRMSAQDLRVLECAGCGRTLLGPSDEPIREYAVSRRITAAQVLPPPVAGRVSERPVCGQCLTRFTLCGDRS